MVREEVEDEPRAGISILPIRLAAELATERRDQLHAEALRPPRVKIRRQPQTLITNRDLKMP